MKIILTADSNVRFSAGDVIDVTEQEAERLKAFGVAQDAPKPKAKPKKAEE